MEIRLLPSTIAPSSWRLPPDSPAPLYRRIAATLAARAKPHERLRLPTERDLARAFAVSRITLRKALEILQNDGFLERRTRKGTFLIYPLRRHLCGNAGG